MHTFILIALSGLGLGALYFLLASGLSLIFGLMRVLNFAHGVFLTVGAFASWIVLRHATDPSLWMLLVAAVVSSAVAGVLALVTERTIIRPLKGKELEQLLATAGLGLALVALLASIWGPDEHLIPRADWITSTTNVAGVPIPNTRFLLIGAAAVIMLAIQALLSRSRYGLVIRAGVENSEMVSALGINVKRSFTAIFTVGGALAGFGGALAGAYYGGVSPQLGDQMLIFAFIVLIIGGLGSIHGALIAAVVLGLAQSLANYYILNGVGDILVVALLVLTLLVRPQGLLGQKGRLV